MLSTDRLRRCPAPDEAMPPAPGRATGGAVNRRETTCSPVTMPVASISRVVPARLVRWLPPTRSAGTSPDDFSRIEARAEVVLTLVEETPDMTLAEIAAHLESEHGLRVSQNTVWRFFQRRGITFKKDGARQRAAASRRTATPPAPSPAVGSSQASRPHAAALRSASVCARSGKGAVPAGAVSPRNGAHPAASDRGRARRRWRARRACLPGSAISMEPPASGRRHARSARPHRTARAPHRG